MESATNPAFKVDENGHYGAYGGRYVPEVLMPALIELEECYREALKDQSFIEELKYLQKTFIGRPTPLYFCENLTNSLGGAKIYLKNEGLAHTGAHKINHCLGQILLAKRMGKKRIVAETGAGQHGLATATVCARFDMECFVYMGAIDKARQRPNVFWMEQLGATVHSVKHGGKRLKDAVNAAIKDWISNVHSTHYLLGSCLGPHPFPEINRYFQSIVGKEIEQQLMDLEGRLPNCLIACVGGGSNSLGAYDIFLDKKEVKLIGVEAGGRSMKNGEHAARFSGGQVGVVEGYKSYWLLDCDGQTMDTHSICAGLDYAGVGPLHALLRDVERVKYTSISDEEAVDALKILARSEGIISALESSHAVAETIRRAKKMKKDEIVVVNLSGRAEKDLFILAKHLKDKQFGEFVENYSKNYTEEI